MWYDQGLSFVTDKTMKQTGSKQNVEMLNIPDILISADKTNS